VIKIHRTLSSCINRYSKRTKKLSRRCRRKYLSFLAVPGEVVLRCRSKSEAKNYAKLHNYGTTEIDWNNLKKLRDENK